MKNSILLIIPFYNGLDLIDPLMTSINSCKKEIIECEIDILLINDSPKNEAVQSALENWKSKLNFLNIELLTNQENLGFVRTMNRGFEFAIEKHSDVIMLNSDTVLFPGSLREICRVARSDDRIGFVSPRTNNATICTFPHEADKEDVNPRVAHDKYLKVSEKLPDFTYVPVVVGFCCFISRNVLINVGFFDQAFGYGYSEEVDLICRASRMGYRCVLANKAFVWHLGEASFSTTSKSKLIREKENSKLITKKYPEYLENLNIYYNSEEYSYEKILSNVHSSNGKIKIGFDFSSFGSYHNGTFEAGIKILDASLKLYSEKYEFHVDISPEAMSFHNLDKNKNLNFSQFGTIDVDNMAIIIRIGQPFSEHKFPELFNSSLVVAVHMLDIIAHECSHLRIGFNRKIWDLVFQYSDIVYGISDYSCMRFKAIFKIGCNTKIVTNRLSLDLRDYEKKNISTAQPNYGDDYILIVGNNFAHKNMTAVTYLLSKNFPEIHFKVMCDKFGQFKNVKFLSPGQITEFEMETLYLNAKAVIFPSLYEGFGLPIFHALSAQKVVFVLDSLLSRELVGLGKFHKNVRMFRDNQDLVQSLRDANLVFSEAMENANGHNWEKCAIELIQSALETFENVKATTVINRMRHINYAVGKNEFHLINPFAVVLLKVAEILNRHFSRGVSFRVLRQIYLFCRSIFRFFGRLEVTKR